MSEGHDGKGGWVGLSLVGFGWSWLELLGWLGWVGLGLVLINYDHRCCCLHCSLVGSMFVQNM